MATTTQVHVWDKTEIGASFLSGATPMVTVSDEHGTSTVLFFHDQLAVENFITVVRKLDHIEPFHLRYMDGCAACEAKVQRIANRLANATVDSLLASIK